MFRGTDNIMQNVLHMKSECSKNYVEYFQS